MAQNFVSNATPLFSKGHLTKGGYSTHMNFVYDKKYVKSRALKEWDFYQILCGDVVVQLTIGHISRFGQISANMFNLKTGARRSVSKLMLNAAPIKKRMPTNPEKLHSLQWFDREMKVQFEVNSRQRRLTLSKNDRDEITTEIDITLTNSSFNKEKMVIATPFDNPKYWYLNYKENCFVANGYCRIDDMEERIVDGNAVLDWGRGVWPRKHQWVWGNGSTIVDGKHFGFNIGWGFGDTSGATENMFFYNNKAYKLTEVHEMKTGVGLQYADNEKNFVFDVVPMYDNYTRTRAPGVNNSCHQVFGVWQGYIKLPDGSKVIVPPFVAFCESAKNCW